MFPAIHLSFLEVVFGAQFLGAAVLLTSAVLVDKLYTRLPRRGRLNARFRRSLLRKVMMLRGRDTEAYLRTVSTAGLDCHLEICEGCAHKTQCKTALREEDASYTAFCPNEKMIDGLQQLQPAHSSPLPSHL